MIRVTYTWTRFKAKVVESNFIISYGYMSDNYYLYAGNSDFELSCVILHDDTDNRLDFEDNYKDTATNLN